jgi:hypothetical protein
VLDTDEAIIDINGWVNLANEQMDLRVKPETKALRLFTLRAPFYVRGTFKQARPQLDKGVLALKGRRRRRAGRVAAPVAALLPLINTGPGKDSPAPPAGRGRRQAEAPPPGQSASVEALMSSDKCALSYRLCMRRECII